MRIRPVEHNDLTWLAEQRNRPELRRWFRQPTLLTSQDQERWFTGIQSFGPSFIIENAIEDPLTRTGCNSFRVGYASLNHVNWVTRSAEFSLFISPEHQKLGLGGQALKWLLDHAFLDLNLHLVYGEVFAGNPAMRLYEGMGFKQDGILRDRAFKEGSYHSSYMISITQDEWRSRQDDLSRMENARMQMGDEG